MTRHYWKTALIVIPALILTLLLSSFVAFGISRFSWRFNIVLLLFFTAGNLLPPQVIAQPLFQMYKRIGLPSLPLRHRLHARQHGRASSPSTSPSRSASARSC